MGTPALSRVATLALGMLGMHGTYEANMTMQPDDLAVGVRF